MSVDREQSTMSVDREQSAMSGQNDKTVRVVTLGCRLNTLESEMIRQAAGDAGVTDAIVVNTCAVTAEAERQARQTIRKLKRENPDTPIVVTGCAAQLHSQAFADMDEVARVAGNAEKLNAATLFGNAPLDNEFGGVAVSDIMAATETAPHLVSGLDGRTRAFVQVQQGCDHRCTFCIIPFARGPNLSVSADAIVQQVRHLVDGGHAEVVLTGVDIMSYGRATDGEGKLGPLAARILKDVPDLKRLRFSSLDPAVMDETLFALLADDARVMPHLHLSIQAADDMVLKRMKRRHLAADAARFIDRARAARPDVVFGADLIAGFPTETAAMHRTTLETIEAWGLSYLHVFPFSARAGTPAAKMPKHSGDVVRARAEDLRGLGDRLKRQTFARLAGCESDVLVEHGRFGHSAHFAPVRLAFDAPAGKIVRVRLAHDGDHLSGETIGTQAA